MAAASGHRAFQGPVGEYTGRIPSAKTLAQEFDVSTRTSERALTSLKDEGLLVAVVGRGFFIKR